MSEKQGKKTLECFYLFCILNWYIYILPSFSLFVVWFTREIVIPVDPPKIVLIILCWADQVPLLTGGEQLICRRLKITIFLGLVEFGLIFLIFSSLWESVLLGLVEVGLYSQEASNCLFFPSGINVRHQLFYVKLNLVRGGQLPAWLVCVARTLRLCSRTGVGHFLDTILFGLVSDTQIQSVLFFSTFLVRHSGGPLINASDTLGTLARHVGAVK